MLYPSTVRTSNSSSSFSFVDFLASLHPSAEVFSVVEDEKYMPHAEEKPTAAAPWSLPLHFSSEENTIVDAVSLILSHGDRNEKELQVGRLRLYGVLSGLMIC
jgi:hypothetical protein